ncbi:hypothetical protein Q8A67_004127 [Cirrhinus molitorella]|uniref:Uncharacterized protein n=1 Tax=Cirrhinus molitorella TaxID=172907 RepID=A0AA88Q9A1_9TELE|nr:hypothetical protein Q8A67_004127 [Cirrhinus molitorella]
MSSDKATVVIQVNPQVSQGTVICDDGQQAGGAYHNTALKGFFKAQPKALGYISAGSLSVAAQNKLHSCVVKASLAMNLISVITAAIAITLMGIEMHLISMPYHRCYYGYNNRMDQELCSRFKKYEMGITGVMLVFSILQFIVSICISGFACKATCNTDSTVVNVALNQTVQILIGVMGFLFGIAHTTNIYKYPYSAFSAISGITYWGSLIYISTGCLSVAAQKKLRLSVMKASFGMNVISAITAAFAIILMSVDIKLLLERYKRHTYQVLNNFDLGITGALLVLSILQFIVAVHITGFACKATCNKNSTVVNVALNQAVQIMIGVTVFLFGIIRTSDVYNFPAVALFSGITYWGSLVNISAGSLTVAAQNKLNPCVVKASLVMNVLSSITAGLAILLMGMEFGLGAETTKYQSCSYGYARTEDRICSFFEGYNLRTPGILLLLTIPQFIISIVISAFVRKATTSTYSTVINVALN